MASIAGIPSTRISDMFIHQRMTNQLLSDQLELLRIQTQLATGRRIELPSEDADSALRIIGLQRLLEQKEQVQNNLLTNQSFLTATDTALSTVADSLAEARGVGVGAIGATVTDQQREAAALQVQEILQQLLSVGNQNFRGRFLFAGTGTNVSPFEATGSNLVSYLGNEGRLSSYSDVDALFDTNLNGSEVFGAISQSVQGAADLNPILTLQTRLADLCGGLGISRGSIAVTCGSSTSTIDLSSAETVGDVAAMIRAGCEVVDLDLEITPTGLKITSASGELFAIREVGGCSMAQELGIRATTPTSSVTGSDLDPALRLTTPLDDVLGVRSYAVVRSSGTDNDIIFEADTVGADLNGIKIVFDDDGSVVIPGTDETASYDSVSRTLTVTVKAGQTKARHVVAAVEAAYALGSVPLSARLDPLDQANAGRGLIDAAPPGEISAQTSGGSGAAFDRDCGLQIVNGGHTHVISLADAQTVEDLLNTLNASQLGLLAEINQGATGINVRSRISGADFMIGENGGTAAAQLGLRTLDADTRLDELNFGRGVTAQDGTDFIITQSDGTQLEVDVSGLETVGEVLDLINALGGGTLQARLALYGNGIELVDQTSGSQSLSVSVSQQSTAAIGLGLIPEGEESSLPGSPSATAQATVVSAGANNDLVFSAIQPGTELNGVSIVFRHTGAEGVDYDPDTRTLTFDINAGSTDANAIISLLALDPVAGALFSATLDAADGTPNNGTGLVADGATAAMSGGSQVLTGSDVNPLETEGVFTALSRLHAALLADDHLEIQRAIEMLDEQTVGTSLARAELGARQQRLESMQLRLEAEDVDLRAALSQDLDVDLVEAASELAAQQVAFQAAMAATASVFQMSLLEYL